MDPRRTRARLRIMKRWAALIFGVPLLLYWGAGRTLGFGLFLCAVSLVVVWFCWHAICHLAHHVRLRLGGHVATARVMGYREDHDADQGGYLALVSFVTSDGDLRPSVPLTFEYEELPRGPERPTPLAERYNVPPVGQTLRVVYDPSDPTWADACASWPMVALAAICGVVGMLLFATLLISTIAVLPQLIERPVTRR
jgi:hypothetical protein